MAWRGRPVVLHASIWAAAALIAATPVAVLAADGVGSDVMPASAAAALRPPALPDAAAVVIELPALSAAESARLVQRQSADGPFRIGVGRAVPEPQDADVLPIRQHWQATSDGRHAIAFRLVSPGALGVRVGLRVVQLPDAAILRFFAPGSPRTPQTTGALVNASVRQNRAAGAAGEAAETY